MDELRKGKLTALPIENLSMTRETNLVYHRDFAHQGDASGYSGAVQKTAAGIWPGLTEPGGSGIVVRYRE